MKSDAGEMELALKQDMLHLQRMAMLYKRRGLMEQAAAVYETLHQLLQEAEQKRVGLPDAQIESSDDAVGGAGVQIAQTPSESSFEEQPKKGGRFVRLYPN